MGLNPHSFYRARAYAVRDVDTGERLSKRYFSKRDLMESIGSLSRYDHTGRSVEIYTTTMSRPAACRKRR